MSNHRPNNAISLKAGGEAYVLPYMRESEVRDIVKKKFGAGYKPKKRDGKYFIQDPNNITLAHGNSWAQALMAARINFRRKSLAEEAQKEATEKDKQDKADYIRRIKECST